MGAKGAGGGGRAWAQPSQFRCTLQAERAGARLVLTVSEYMLNFSLGLAIAESPDMQASVVPAVQWV